MELMMRRVRMREKLEFGPPVGGLKFGTLEHFIKTKN
jgi:hypothetical protein